MPPQEKVVEIPGVGSVAFPSSMSDEQIAAVIKGKILNKQAPTPTASRSVLSHIPGIETGSKLIETALGSLVNNADIALGAVGGMLGGPLGAGLGGALGEGAKQVERFMRNDPEIRDLSPGQLALDTAKKELMSGGLQSAFEGVGSIVSKQIGKIPAALDSLADVSPTMRAIIDKYNLSLTVGQRAKALGFVPNLIRHVENSSARTLAGRAYVTSKRIELMGNVEAAANDILEQIGKTKEIGRVGTTLKNFRENVLVPFFKDQSNALFTSNRELQSKNVVDMSGVSKKIEAYINPRLPALQVAPRINALTSGERKIIDDIMGPSYLNDIETELTVKRIAGATGKKAKMSFPSMPDFEKPPLFWPFSAAQQTRSELLSIGREATELQAGKAQALAKIVAPEIEKAMETAAQQLSPDAFQVYYNANEFYKFGKPLLTESVISDLARTSPEKIVPMVKTTQDLLEMKSAILGIPEKGKASAETVQSALAHWDNFRNSWIRTHLLSQAGENEITEQQFMNLSRKLKALPSGSKEILFLDETGKQVFENLKALSDVTERIQPLPKNSRVGVYELFTTFMGTLVNPGKAIGSVGRITQLEAGSAGLSSLLHNPKATRELVTGLLKAAKHGTRFGLPNVSRAIELINFGDRPKPEEQKSLSVFSQ